MILGQNLRFLQAFMSLWELFTDLTVIIGKAATHFSFGLQLAIAKYCLSNWYMYISSV